MDKNKPNSLNTFLDESKGTKKPTQKKIAYEYLQSNVATASMVTEATEIKQKSLTWIKRDYEKRGLLWQIEKRFCKVTKRRAWYLTTNPELIPPSTQLKLF